MSIASDPLSATPGFAAGRRRTPGTVIGLYLGFFTSGILISPDLPYVGTKLATPDIFLIFVIIGTFLAGDRHGSLWAHRDRILVATFLGLAFVYHTALSMLVNGIFFEADIAMSIISTFNYWYGFFVFACVVKWLDSWDRLATAVAWWIAGATLVGVIGTWGIIGGAPAWVYEGPRISSTLRGVNQMQSYLIPVLYASLVLALSPVVSGQRRLLLLACILPMTLSLLATGSRSTMIMILACIGILTYQILRQGKRTLTAFVLSYSLAGGLILGMILMVWITLTGGADMLPPGPWQRPIRLFQAMLQASDTVEALGPRGIQFKIIFDNWFYRPILGIGPANFKEVFDHPHEIHNTYLGMLSEHGVVGLSLLLAFSGLVISGCLTGLRLLRDPMQRILIIMIAGAAPFVMIYGVFSFGLRQRIFWLTLGLTAAAARIAWLQWKAEADKRGIGQAGT